MTREKNIKKTNKIEIVMMLGTFFLWAVEILLFVFIFPQYRGNFIVSYLIGFFFFTLSIFFINLIGRLEKKKITPQKNISITMAFSMVPLLFSIIVIFLYMNFVKTDVMEFLIVYITFYLWFLFMKLAVLCKMEKKNKKPKTLKYED